jgi:hypothetical protein
MCVSLFLLFLCSRHDFNSSDPRGMNRFVHCSYRLRTRATLNQKGVVMCIFFSVAEFDSSRSSSTLHSKTYSHRETLKLLTAYYQVLPGIGRTAGAGHSPTFVAVVRRTYLDNKVFLRRTSVGEWAGRGVLFSKKRSQECFI